MFELKKRKKNQCTCDHFHELARRAVQKEASHYVHNLFLADLGHLVKIRFVVGKVLVKVGV